MKQYLPGAAIVTESPAAFATTGKPSVATTDIVVAVTAVIKKLRLLLPVAVVVQPVHRNVSPSINPIVKNEPAAITKCGAVAEAVTLIMAPEVTAL